jgi:hypothetical protein
MSFSCQCDCRGDSKIRRMRDADAYVCNPKPICDFLDFAIERYFRLAGSIIYNLDISPGYLAAPTGTHQLENSFLCGKTACQLLYAVLIRIGIGLFSGSKDPFDKSLAVPLYHLFYSGTIYKVYTVCYNFHFFILLDSFLLFYSLLFL